MANAHKRRPLESFARSATIWAGRSAVFACAAALVLGWLAFGPITGWSNAWQLWMNTITTIVTFLMVFLIQRSQNKDALATHLQLNEVIAAIEGASNRLLNVEDLTEAELKTLHTHYERLAHLAARDLSLTKSHSVEEAESRHTKKHGEPARSRRGKAKPDAEGPAT